jgi:hypothetical protein
MRNRSVAHDKARTRGYCSPVRAAGVDFGHMRYAERLGFCISDPLPRDETRVLTSPLNLIERNL